ncbi:MAG: D-alanine--D-alanine ligase [Hyphomicrobiales bacterium]|nr:D-alanine--D-alanine ligase [Hyphomicrobiales bacterium]
MAKRVAVLMGGPSAERDVSLRSGAACAKALRHKGHEAIEIDAGPDLAGRLADARPDVAFNALHGRFGEDGTVQGLLEVLRIPYTHSGVLASALAMRKDFAKLVLSAAGVPVARGLTLDRREAAREHPLPPPYVVKPVDEGSSVGVIIVRKGRSHPPQELLRGDWSHGDSVLVESYIAGRELTCAAYGGRALGVIEIKPAHGEFYDYDAKYAKGGSIHVLPAQIKPDVYLKIQELTVTAHRALGCRGVSRADFRLDDGPGGDATPICLEVNTQPGMTETSLVPEMATHAGMSFADLVEWMVEDASCDR